MSFDLQQSTSSLRTFFLTYLQFYCMIFFFYALVWSLIAYCPWVWFLRVSSSFSFQDDLLEVCYFSFYSFFHYSSRPFSINLELSFFQLATSIRNEANNVKLLANFDFKLQDFSFPYIEIQNMYASFVIVPKSISKFSLQTSMSHAYRSEKSSYYITNVYVRSVKYWIRGFMPGILRETQFYLSRLPYH